jgi:hypothetical protein
VVVPAYRTAFDQGVAGRAGALSTFAPLSGADVYGVRGEACGPTDEADA